MLGLALKASLTVAGGAHQAPALGPRVDRYLRRHPKLSGGVSVEDNWPREPYLLVRVTRDADRYERVLRRLARFPRNLRTEVTATELTSPSCADLLGYRPAPDGMSIVVSYEAGGGAAFDHVELVEHPDRIEVAVVVQRFNGPTTAESQPADVVIPLATPLGTRAVVDTTAGERLPVTEPGAR